MKHRAKLIRNGFKISPRASIRKEVPHFEMDCVDEGFGLERSSGCSFRSVLETFLSIRVLLRESDRDLWTPIVNKTVADVDHVHRKLGKARYPSTKKLLNDEFGKKVLALKNGVAIKICPGFFVTFLNVDDGYTFRTEIPTTAVAFFSRDLAAKPKLGTLTSSTGMVCLPDIS